MKTRTRYIVLGVIVLAAVVLFAACKGNKGTGPAAGSAGGTLAQAEKAKPGAEKTIYHCPMHPTYTSDKPGDCPICGMKLVPVEPQEKPAAARLRFPRRRSCTARP